MLTTHGAKMSPRMERLWTYLREERGIDTLNDWATDECVEGEQERLRAAVADLEERVAAAPGDRDLAHLLDDVRTIANRRPHERTDAAMERSRAAALRARGEVGRDAIGDEIAGKAGR